MIQGRDVETKNNKRKVMDNENGVLDSNYENQSKTRTQSRKRKVNQNGDKTKSGKWN